MRYLKYFVLLLAVLAVPAVHSQAQVAIGVGIHIGPDYGFYHAPPVCEWGFYPTYPFGCAPYGYYGSEWFVDGVFIGAGPWRNAKGEVIANNLDELHGNNKLTKQTALNEKGEVVNGRGDTPNRHDILTGSQPNGTAFPAGEDRTCRNWTSSTQGAAMLGHHDRRGLSDDEAARSWNSSHTSRGPEGGCSQADLRSTGGDGLLYCFAEK